ncbi:MAG: SH3 domain-containing protein [Anaerolineales bacterium]
MSTFRKVLISLLLIIFIQGCILTGGRRQQFSRTEPTLTLQAAAVLQDTATVLPTTAPLAAPTVAPTATVILPTSLPSVTVTASDGNLYIRRGPGLAYDAVGFLMKGVSAQVIGQDVLSKWVQINIPDSGATGWVSIQTPFSKINGDISQVPNFTFTEWPEPAYLKNCTEHDMFIVPGNIYLYSLYTNPKYLNEVQVDPDTYTAYDMFYPDEPEAQMLQVHEGMTGYITINGVGEGHKCP